MKRKVLLVVLFTVLCVVFCAGTALADNSPSVVSSDNLSLSNISVAYQSGSVAGAGEVGKLMLTATVNGPEDVRLITASLSRGNEWNETIIASYVSSITDLYQHNSMTIPSDTPPFQSTILTLVFPENLGKTGSMLVVGIGEDYAYIGHAIVQVDVPEDDSAGDAVIASGNCGGEGNGSNLTWTLNGGGVLTISGTGAMADYESGNTEGSIPILPSYSRYSDSIRSVVFADGVTSVGDNAFSYYPYSNLTSVMFSDSITSIGERAFLLKGIMAVSFPDGLTSIGAQAFAHCDRLTSVHLPNSLESIGETAFGGCDNLTDVCLPDNSVLIGKEAFAFNSNLESIVIPSGMTVIGERMFYLCTGLESIQISDGVLEIGVEAFNCCHGFSSIVIPASVTRIGNGAFHYCQNLSSVKLMCNGTAIGDDVFGSCNKLSSISFSGTISSIGQWANIIDNVSYSGTDEQWLSFVRLWHSAVGFFDDQTLKHIIGSNVVESIIGMGYCGGDEDGTNIAWKIMPGGILVLSGAGEMSQDTSWIYPNKWEWLGNQQYNQTIDDYKFNIVRVVVGAGISSIPDSCFSDCAGITDVSLPDTLKIIGNEAFSYCYSLSSINLPNSLTMLGDRAFEYCSSLTSIVLPDSLISVGMQAFSWCSELTHISMGTNIETMKNQVFIGAPIETVSFTYTTLGKRTVPSHAFSDCDCLENVFLPEGIIAIGSGAFSGCDSLTEITIPSSMTSIGDHAFSYSALESLVISEGVMEIGGWAFAGTELEAITIPNAVQYIGYYAFGGCGNLRKVTIGLDTGSYYEGGRHCWYQSEGNYNGGSFQSSPVTTLVLTPGDINPSSQYSSLSGQHCSDIAYSDFINHFFYSTPIETIVLSDGIHGISSWAFDDCDDLKALYIPKSVKFVEGNCIDMSVAPSVDVYYAGSRYAWGQMMNFGHEVDEPIFKAKIHYGETYKPPERRTTYSTTDFITIPESTTITTGGPSVPFVSGVRAGSYLLYETDPRIVTGWDFDLLKNSSRTGVPSRNLAVSALVLSANVYTDKIFSTLETFGFDKFGWSFPDNYLDINQVGHVIASTTKIIDGQRTNVIAVVCRGSANGPDWLSNVFAQANGFRSAAQRVKQSLNTFITNANLNTALPTKLFITGHSRGAAVANVLGTMVSDITSDDNVFVYTFACPNTTTDRTRGSYSNIFNFTNSADPVPAVPIMDGGNNRFGYTLNYYNFENMPLFSSAFSALTGASSVEEAYNYSESSYAIRVSSLSPGRLMGHSPAIYMACILSTEEWGSFTTKYNRAYTGKVISVKCPVDVLVYDEENKLLGKIENNIPDDDLATSGVFVLIDGDEKYIYTTSETNLYLELVGNDDGTMSFSVQTMDSETGNVVEEKDFSGVVLTAGKTMTSAVADDIAVPDTQLLLVSDGAITAEIDENGNETEVVIVSFNTDLGEPLRDMTVPKGTAPGELPTAKMDGFAFEGWYTDAELTSPFDPAAALNSSMTLYAKYTPLYDVFGWFRSISYDGEALTATLEYDYNTCGSNLYVALYQDGQMLAIQAAQITSGDASANVTLPVSGLYGIYELKAFTLDSTGAFAPISDSASATFYAN